jgi:hypothetical protein
MTRNGNLILAVEIFLLAIYAGSAFALTRNSDDFILANRRATLPPLETGSLVELGRPGPNGGILLGGWARESWGIRSSTARPQLTLKLPPGAETTLTFSGRLTIPDGAGQQFDILLDGHRLATLTATGPRGIVSCAWSLALPAPVGELSVLTFTGLRPASPRELGLGTETRGTALALETLSLASSPSPATCGQGGTLTVAPA